jgi:putative effector of murein hydrolase LrgA (UPF0299 family)
MIAGLAVLLICQLAGEAVARGLGLPLPGPVLGLVFLVGVAAMSARWRGDDRLVAPESPVGRVADGLIGALALLFVPAGVGVVQHLDLLARNGTAIGVALVVSTLAALIATVGTYRLVRRAMGTSDTEVEP